MGPTLGGVHRQVGWGMIPMIQLLGRPQVFWVSAHYNKMKMKYETIDPGYKLTQSTPQKSNIDTKKCHV